MQALFMTIYNAFQWLFGVVPKSARGSKTLFRILHYSAVVLITAVLAYFSDRIVDPADLDLDSEIVRRCWVGILFLLSYLFVRLLIYLINLLLIRDEPEFRDIDRCWQIGMSELQRAGMDITYLPVFLVNGLTVEEESNTFQGAGMNWKVVAPGFDDRAAVLRFFATDDALFISLTGVGATTLQRMQRPQTAAAAPQFGGGGGGAAPVRHGTLRREDLAIAQEAAAAPPQSFGGGRTLPAGGLKGVLAGMNPPPAAAPRPAGGGPQRTMMPGAIRGESAAPAYTSPAAGRPSAGIVPRLEPEDRNRSERRMAYLTYLLKRDRAPFCPLNGMLQAVPMSWADRMRDITELTPSVADDLKVLAVELEMSSPLVVMYVELEKLPGFEEFLTRCSRQTPHFRDSRAGSRFPAGKPVDNETAHWVVDRCLQWFQGWTYSGLAQDVDSSTNSRLYRLLCELNDRRGRFEQQLKELKVSHTPGGATAWRLSGCYYVATGNGSARQAFATGVLQKAIGEQNDVSWSDRLLRRDSRSRVAGWLLLSVGVLLAAANAAAVWWLTKGGTTPPAA